MSCYKKILQNYEFNKYEKMVVSKEIIFNAKIVAVEEGSDAPWKKLYNIYK